MTIKNILVSFNDQPPSVAALTMAMHLAQQHDAHLTDVLAHGLLNMYYAYSGITADTRHNP